MVSVMQDTRARTFVGRWHDVIMMGLGCMLGIICGIGFLTSEKALPSGDRPFCLELIESAKVVPMVTFGSFIFLNPLRHRNRSVQRLPIAILKILLALTVTAGAITLFVYVIRDIITVIRIVGDSDLRLHHCGEVLVSATILQLAVAPLIALYLLTTVVFIIYLRFVFMKPDATHLHGYEKLIRYIRTPAGYCVPMVFYPKQGAKHTIIYSHGNAVDLGQILAQGKLRGLRDELNCNVISYEYAGYGYAGGPSTEKDLVECLEAVLEAATFHYGIKQASILLYGRSIGSCPTVQLAAKLKSDAILGVVLESPPLSMLRTVGCIQKLCCCTLPFDLFTSIDYISSVKSPVQVTHGTIDDIVPLSHGKQLHAAAAHPYPKPHWVEGANHNNMPDVWHYRIPAREAKLTDEEYDAKLALNEVLNSRNREMKKNLLGFIEYCVKFHSKESSEANVGLHDVKIDTTTGAALVQSLLRTSIPEDSKSDPNDDSFTNSLDEIELMVHV